MLRAALLLLTLSLLVLGLAGAQAPGARTTLPAGAGLAGDYPRDQGLEGDPRVLVRESFEAGTLEEVTARWRDVSNAEGKVLALSDVVPPTGSGRRSLAMTATLGENYGGHLYGVLPREVDVAYCRFYVRFAEKPEYIHHFVHLGGYRPATPWPQGGAGQRPEGHERVTVGIEPHGVYGQYPPPGIWSFYCYWPDMKISADGRYWGNALRPSVPAQVPAGRWQCVEFMVKLNSAPEEYDGELALWLDGALVAHFARGVQRGEWTGMGFDLVEEGGQPFEGFRWRTTTDLKLNFVWLLHYVTEYAGVANEVTAPNPLNTVWFDDLVVATDYIGPVAAG